MTPAVPPLHAEWPPDRFQLAELVTRTHWGMEQVAWDLTKGTATRGQLDEMARALEGLAQLLRQHEVNEGESADMPAHAWYPDGTRSKGFGSATDDTSTSETDGGADEGEGNQDGQAQESEKQ